MWLFLWLWSKQKYINQSISATLAKRWFLDFFTNSYFLTFRINLISAIFNFVIFNDIIDIVHDCSSRLVVGKLHGLDPVFHFKTGLRFILRIATSPTLYAIKHIHMDNATLSIDLIKVCSVTTSNCNDTDMARLTIDKTAVFRHAEFCFVDLIHLESYCRITFLDIDISV